MGAGAAAVVQQVTWEEALRAGRLLFGPRADALFAGAGWRDELKRAYKRRVLETHPDRALALGRPESELAREFRAVADAYRLLQEAPDARLWLRARPATTPAARRSDPRAAAAAEAAARARREAEARRGERARRAEQERRREAARRAEAEAQDAELRRARREAEARREVEARRGERARRAEQERRREAARRAEAEAQEAELRRARCEAEVRAEAERAARGRARARSAAPDWRHVVKPRPMPRRRVRLAEFLYYSGRISWAELVDAIAWQRRQRPAVGRIAVEFGFLTPIEVIQVIERRGRAGAHDVPFGEFALRLGMITPFQRLAMVGRQGRLQRPIGQYFVERGIVSEHEFDDLRRQVVRHNLRHYA